MNQVRVARERPVEMVAGAQAIAAAKAVAVAKDAQVETAAPGVQDVKDVPVARARGADLGPVLVREDAARR